MKLTLMNPSYCKWVLTEEAVNGGYLRGILEQFKQLIAGEGGKKGETLFLFSFYYID